MGRRDLSWGKNLRFFPLCELLASFSRKKADIQKFADKYFTESEETLI